MKILTFITSHHSSYSNMLTVLSKSKIWNDQLSVLIQLIDQYEMVSVINMPKFIVNEISADQLFPVKDVNGILICHKLIFQKEVLVSMRINS
ncbi:hypothetical protein T08_16757 [Trichinella sp. T8]|nr:hypothetical protein T08_16757 [Trichinella sp. T8]